MVANAPKKRRDEFSRYFVRLLLSRPLSFSTALSSGSSINSPRSISILATRSHAWSLYIRCRQRSAIRYSITFADRTP